MKVCPTCSSQWPDEQKFCPNDGSALRSTAGAADLIGSVIGGNYHIMKKLGEGGMGAVYLGEHVKMSRKSAIKVMTQSMVHDPDAIARFNREATNAARINHPNVCAIYDFGETTDGLIFLAMEFIEGGSLTSIIESEGALPPQRAARILQQTGDALQAAHDLGIVHRDLKPDNIMIARARDGGDMVKVVDFGIAKAMGGEEGQKVTKTGLVVGTPEYMSPEQLSGDKLDGRSDIYSLALVFFRTLTGTLPFQADSAQETMIKRLTDDPMKLSEAMPGANFPARLQQVMDRALARMPSERYASAAEFARDVVRAVESMGSGASAGGDGATQIISAQNATTAAVAATRVSTARPSAKTVVNTPPTPKPQATVARPADKKAPVALIATVVGVLVVGGGTAALMMNKGNGGTSTRGKEAESVTPSTAQPQQQADNPAALPAPAGGTSQPVRQPAGNTTTPTNDSPGRQQPQNVVANPAAGGPTSPAGATDSLRIKAQLDDILEDLGDPDSVALARRRATDIYVNEKNPQSLRAEAAMDISIAYMADDKGEACRWIGYSLQLRPGWDPAAKHRQRLACS